LDLLSSSHNAKGTSQVNLIQLFRKLPGVAIIITIQVKICLIAAQLCIIRNMPDRIDKIGVLPRLGIYRLWRSTIPLASSVHHLVGDPKEVAYITRILNPDIGTALI
jgi:hypothetical protein